MAASKEATEKAERIRALNKINEDVASLLQSAGSALKSLTTAPPDLAPTDDPLQARKDAYLAEVTTLFTTFTRIRDGLAAEADALENAKLMPSNPPKTLREDEQGLTNGGLGKFDIGWLNSRGNAVLQGKEKELWAEARRVLEKLEEREPAETKGSTEDQGHEDQSMSE